MAVMQIHCCICVLYEFVRFYGQNFRYPCPELYHYYDVCRAIAESWVYVPCNRFARMIGFVGWLLFLVIGRFALDSRLVMIQRY